MTDKLIVFLILNFFKKKNGIFFFLLLNNFFFYKINLISKSFNFIQYEQNLVSKVKKNKLQFFQSDHNSLIINNYGTWKYPESSKLKKNLVFFLNFTFLNDNLQVINIIFNLGLNNLNLFFLTNKSFNNPFNYYTNYNFYNRRYLDIVIVLELRSLLTNFYHIKKLKLPIIGIAGLDYNHLIFDYKVFLQTISDFNIFVFYTIMMKYYFYGKGLYYKKLQKNYKHSYITYSLKKNTLFNF